MYSKQNGVWSYDGLFQEDKRLLDWLNIPAIIKCNVTWLHNAAILRMTTHNCLN
jgi:hypothetical protein